MKKQQSKRGFVLVGAVVLILLLFFFWSLSFRKLTDIYLLEKNHESQRKTETAYKNALAQALTLMETSTPSVFPYFCLLKVSNGVDSVYQGMTFEQAKEGNWILTSSDDSIGEECPAILSDAKEAKKG